MLPRPNCQSQPTRPTLTNRINANHLNATNEKKREEKNNYPKTKMHPGTDANPLQHVVTEREEKNKRRKKKDYKTS